MGVQLPGAVKFANFSTTGDGTIVTGVTDKKIRVLSMVASATVSEAFDIRSGASTVICGPLRDISTVTLVLNFCEVGHFETTAGANLQITILTGTTTVAGSVVYVEV